MVGFLALARGRPQGVLQGNATWPDGSGHSRGDVGGGRGASHPPSGPAPVPPGARVNEPPPVRRAGCDLRELVSSRTGGGR